jgi:nitroreductase
MRTSEYPVHELILRRWSPRAMSGEKVSKENLMSLFEAARWAPSSYNEQEWRFLWAEKGTPHWDSFFSLLVEANQVWCAQGSHLIVLLYKETFTQTGEKNGVAQLDAGAAMQNLLLQATELGLVAHPMGGFDWTRAVELLEVPSGFSIGAMIVVGHPAAPTILPTELQNMESPSGRKELCEFVSEGLFSFES